MITKGSVKLAVGAVVLALVVAAGGWHEAVLDSILRSSVRHAVDRYDTTPLYDGNLHVIFCGTGSVYPDATRAQGSIAVLAGGTLAIFDTGDGSARRAALLGLPLGDLNVVFFTNLHSDHIGDLGQFAEASWRQGRVTPLQVYGPAGTSQVVAGFDQAYGLSVKFRAAHANEVNLPADNALPAGHDVKVMASALVPVWQAHGLRISAFLEDHPPVQPAFGYRVEYRGRVVVIAGDTRPNANLARQARNADVLIASAYQASAIARLAHAYDEDFGSNARPGSRDLGRSLRSLEDYDSSVAEVGEEAAQAGAGMLVLTRLEPDPGSGFTGWLLRSWYLHPARSAFHGRLLLAQDGTRLTLAPAH